jgi:hypothetical protein
VTGDLKVIDISNPTMPTLTGSLVLGFGTWSVAVAGNYACVITLQTNDLKMIDISDPTAPLQTGILPIGGALWSFALSGRYAYVLDAGSDALKVIDIYDPTMPTEIISLDIGMNPTSIFVVGDYAYVTDKNSDDFSVIKLACLVQTALTYDLQGGLSIMEIIETDPKIASATTNAVPVWDGSVLVDGKITDDGTKVHVNGGLFIEGSGVGVSNSTDHTSNHVATFYNNSGTQNASGIAIKIKNDNVGMVNNTRNNYVTFFNEDGTVAGRIEGFDVETNPSGIFTDMPSLSFEDLFDLSNMNAFVTFAPAVLGTLNIAGLFLGGLVESTGYNGGSLGNSGSSFQSAVFNNSAVAGFKKASGDSKLNEMICWALENGLEGLITTNPFDLALAGTIITQLKQCTDNGVIYGATGADYAEYLEKVNPEENFISGQIVGVHGGKITKVTEGADQILPVSLAPIVLGNMPPEAEQDKFEKVGFLGQVPVLVWGKVEVGDYIIPSGKNDGMGIAVNPNDLKIGQMKQVVGRAWEAGENPRMNIVNTSIGLKTTEWAEIMEKQENKLNSLEDRMSKMEALLTN